MRLSYMLYDGLVLCLSDCPADLTHFELSYWAFEQLAHPLYPRMMLEYR